MSTPTILQNIIATKHQEVTAAKASVPLEQLISIACAHKPRGFASALRGVDIASGRIGVISEIKKASPSKGLISPNFDPVACAIGYEQAGATCLSVLTDKDYFLGADEYLIQAKNATTLPILRKDFMVDEYQIIQSAAMGADCILLIMACLDDKTVAHLHTVAVDYGLDVLIEIHTAEELERALQLPRSVHNIYGVNNRDLHTFVVDLQHSLKLVYRLQETLGADALIVTESGIDSIDDVRLMQSHGIHHFLIGEQFMKTGDAGGALARLLAQL